VRTAPVLLKNGGILLQLLKLMRFGFAFIFGSGNQWFSWIHMSDLLRIYHFAATDETLSCPINACAPNPVRFRDFIFALTKYKKAIVIPFPVWILKLYYRKWRMLSCSVRKWYRQNCMKEIFTSRFPHWKMHCGTSLPTVRYENERKCCIIPLNHYILNFAASFIASIMLEGSAIPFHAISYAVPWSGEVRMNGRPTVTFTPLSNAIIFRGISP